MYEKSEGYVTRLVSPGIVGVTIEDDFEIPVAVNEIVLVNRAEQILKEPEQIDGSNMPAEVSQHASSPDIQPADLNSLGISLAFAEDKSLKYLLHRYIVNTSDYDVLVHLYLESKGVFSSEILQKAAAKSILQLPALSLKDVETWPVFHFQLVFVRKGNFAPVSPREHTLKLRSKHFSLGKKNLPLLADPGYLFSLDPAASELDAVKLREHILSANLSPGHIQERPASEIDLHLEALPDYHRNIQTADALKMQLDYFQKNLDAALSHNMESITFIHGVGNGVLRQEIMKRLSKHAYVRTWKDAGKDRFGYGATEVFFK